MGNIHLNCLRKWVEQKVSIKAKKHVTTVEWKSLSCELCKAPYPFAVCFDGMICEVIKVPCPKKPFAVFEKAAEYGKNSGTIYIVSFDKKQRITIGRNSDAEWQLINISISRAHAILTYNSSELFLEDINSKYGSFKQVSSPIVLQLNNKLAFQIVSTLCLFRVEKKPSLFSCFGSKAKSSKHFRIEKEMESQYDFPNNGLHSLLIVNKKKYQRMIKSKECKSLERKLSEERKEELEEKRVVEARKERPSVVSKGVHLRFANNIRMLDGDTADDVIGE
eukprot:TRINITY_DN9323_c0_g2_i3.p2 TRINITY_DN9323_c0_g2~~TRINITY_DN9323_c0_g2_i3.p2  ORF type:complete len:278 (+),score=99.22 TRINITY_DN9323_c0_g2_i3:818-1651(+)